MIDRTEAEDHLRVIRSLMEKATIYRALSAPAALIGGLLSVGASVLVPCLERTGIGTEAVLQAFYMVWSAVFIVTAIASLKTGNSTLWWIACYGLALLAMTHFAPRSIVILGWCFVASAALAISGILEFIFQGWQPHPGDGPSLLLGFTFGLFHIVYAACTWPRRKA